MKMAEWWKAGKAGRTRLQVIVSGDCLEVETFCEDSDPAWQIRPALGKGTTICRTRKWVGRTAVSVTDRRRSNRLPRRQYGNSGEAACGLDVHQATVVACLLIVLANGKVKKQIRTSGMCMLTALAEGKATPAEMAALAKGRLQEKIPQLEPALDGRLEEHHRYLLKLQLRRMRDLDQDLEDLEARIRERLQPYQEQWALLREIPKVDWTLAAVIIAEPGVDMKVSPRPPNWPPGRACVRGIMNRRANAKALAPPQATSIRRRPWWKRPTPPRERKGPICATSTTGSKPGGGPSGPRSPSRTRFW